MDTIFQAITDWLKEMLVSGIMDSLSGMFDAVNQQVADVASQVGTSPAGFSPGVFSMIRNVSESVIIPIAGLILTFIACYELIQLIIDHNNLANYETWMDINMNYSEENNPIALKTTVSNRELKSMVEFYKKDLVPKYDIPEL